jgi:hypothetical protein
MPRCPECDERVLAGEAECPSCGASLKKGNVKGSGVAKGVSVGVILACVLGGCCLTGGVLGLALGLPAVQQARNAARLTQSRNNLKILGIAIHNYHDTYRTLPLGISADPETGTPHHAWMARLLPFVESTPLYDRINFNVPWTDAANKPPYSVAIPSFQNPSVEQKMDASGYGLAHYAGNSQLFGERNKRISIADCTDGLTNTLFVGEVGAGYQPWGSTENHRDTAAGIGISATQFGSPIPGRVQILMGDGATRILTSDVDPNLFKALGTPDGHEDMQQLE